MIRHAAAALTVVVFIGMTVPAYADKETSIQLYRAGKRKYELAQYDKAIALFKQAYDEHPAPAYLYNIAQAYLKLDACRDALEHFEQFVAEKPDAKNRAEVDAQIATLGEQCPKVTTPDPVEETPIPDPVEEVKVADSSTGTGTDTGTEASDTGISKTAPPASGPRLFAVAADVGLSFFDIGDVIVPVSPTLRLAAAYPLEVIGISLEPGAAVELATMAYDHADGDATVMFTTLLVGATARVELAPKISAGGDLGLGLFRFSGLKAGNPFIAGLAEQMGSVTSFALRFGAVGEYDIGNGLAAAFSPAIVWASGSNDLRDEISSFTRFELMLGVRYRR